MNRYYLLLELIGVIVFIFNAHRLFRYLRYFQQEQYISHRFLGWLVRNFAFDKKASISLLIIWSLLPYLRTSGAFFLSALTLLGLVIFEENPRKQGKLKLVMTTRAKWIFRVALALNTALLIYIECLILLETFSSSMQLIFLHIVAIQAVPFFIVLANFLLKPFERRKQHYFLNDAKKILSEINPYIIGITGSYGKTSTKNILGEILHSAVAPTFYPEKGVNTPMGITREIRNKLKPGHRYGVIEMGAFKKGSIKKLCDLTPPRAGIITAVGIMHLDRFGGEDNILKAKAELAEALPKNGILVCNGENEGAKKIATLHKKEITLLYGFEKQYDCWISESKITTEGMSFTVNWNGKSHHGRTKLLGKPALSNILASFTMGCALGGEPETLLAAIYNIKPIDNRLALDKVHDITYLRDAYNSNPTGFSAALDVLEELPGQRKITITPGMIELGKLQFRENENIGQLMAKICDLVIIVGHENRQAIVSGLNKTDFNEEKILLFDDRDTAFSELTGLQRSGDVILVENDLPDLYEQVGSF